MAADVLHDARPTFDGATARSAELLQAELDRFELLLTDLLEISRFDAGAAQLDLGDVDVRTVVRRVVEAFAALAADRGSELTVILPETPVWPRLTSAGWTGFSATWSPTRSTTEKGGASRYRLQLPQRQLR
ncbi:MAG: hypothetical protein WKF73_12725 [Nocardioidaceae bacterium]